MLAGVDLPWRIYRFLILGYIPWFAIGISIYILVHARDTVDLRKPLVMIAAALALLALVDSPGVGLLGLAMTTLVWGAATRKLPWLSRPFMAWLGAISYTLYLLHENIGWAVLLRLRDWGVPRDAGIVCAIALSLGIATALTRLVEQPAMAWIRRRWRERRAQTPAELGGHGSRR